MNSPSYVSFLVFDMFEFLCFQAAFAAGCEKE